MIDTCGSYLQRQVTTDQRFVGAYQRNSSGLVDLSPALPVKIFSINNPIIRLRSLTRLHPRHKMEDMHFQSWSLSDKGLKRHGNQDSFMVDERAGVFIVADGVGGHMGGEVASALAVETAREVIAHPKANMFTPKEVLMQAYRESNFRIFQRAHQEAKLSGMGTTMVMAYVRASRLYIANVGDSRCYLYRKPYVWQLTEDHSLVNEQIRMGILSEEVARKTIAKNVITRSVGFEPEVFPDIIEREITVNDTYILCSDGLSGMITDQRIAQILNEAALEKAAPQLLQQALTNGGDDNVTVLVLNFQE